MESGLLSRLADKSLTKGNLLRMVEKNPELIPAVIEGVSSPKAAVRYGCSKVLVDISERQPETLYPFFDTFVNLLGGRYRILTWNATAIIANLSGVDADKKFDAVFDKYFGLLGDEYMVTVANAVSGSSKIATAKPYMASRIAEELLKVEGISTTPHLSEECRRVITEQAIQSLASFFGKINQKDKVIAFAERQLNSPRRSLREKALNLLSLNRKPAT